MIANDAGQAVVDLGRLVFRFAEVKRITFHPDGVTSESDTTHTVMLGLVACAFADRYLPDLDQGKIAQYALVHDLVEAYAGDTPTLNGLTLEQKWDKNQRERDAEIRIQQEFVDSLPWLPRMIAFYEFQLTGDSEARYVKAMDKLMPKITHLLNQGVSYARQGATKDQMVERYRHQFDEMQQYAADFPPLFELREQLIEMVFEHCFKEET